jgi:hypothetical protein
VAHLEAEVARRVDNRDRAARGQRVVQAFDAQHVARFDRVVVGGIAEEQRCDAELTRFWPWMRANALAMTARRPRKAGTSAPCSRMEPCP